jgi:fluoride exporter
MRSGSGMLATGDGARPTTARPAGLMAPVGTAGLFAKEALAVPLVLIAAGGAAGAVLRYLADGWVAQAWAGPFPLGTFVVNVTGSLVLGILFAMTVERDLLPAGVRGPLMIGFLGAFTTFSTLMLESWRLIEDGAIGLGLANLVGSAALGVGAVVLGLTIGRALA